MPYTDNPAGNPLDTVRFLVGQTASTSTLTDNEVAYLLAEEGGNIYRAAARAAESLAASFTSVAEDKQVGPLRLKQSRSQADKYAALARRLWRRAGASGGAIPYAGGISYADKMGNIQNTDRVQPAFRRGLQRYRNTSVRDNWMPEEIVSSEEILP